MSVIDMRVISWDNVSDPLYQCCDRADLIADCCFYCGGIIKSAAVYWSGGPNKKSIGLVLHGGCAREFALRLIVDGAHAMQFDGSHPKPPAPSAVPSLNGSTPWRDQ